MQTFDLGGGGLPDMELVTSAQPCIMCAGAVLWSGVKSLLFGASAEDVEAITGFDEGPLHPKWREELEKRGVRVMGPLLESEANVVLRDYVKTGQIYNARQGND